jgi:hypothetical protein
MSTLAYAQVTTRREDAEPGTSVSTSPPGMKTYVDALAALVPSEVLALHALFLSVTTKAEHGTTRITDPHVLAWAFLGLLIVSVGLYAAPRLLAKKWDSLDWFRMAIPPLAFIGWTMLQRATAFDAVFPGVGDATRTVVALFLAVILGVGAAALAYKADQKPPA